MKPNLTEVMNLFLRFLYVMKTLFDNRNINLSKPWEFSLQITLFSFLLFLLYLYEMMDDY